MKRSRAHDNTRRLFGIRLHATPHATTATDEITWLAIVETIASTSTAIFLAVTFDALFWVAISSCVAPFLLLRTERSTKLGIALFDPIYIRMERVMDYAEWYGAIGVVLGFMLYPFFVMSYGIIAILCRVAATLWTVLSAPLISLSSIPANWSRYAFCIDATRQPEVVPGYNELGSDLQFRAYTQIYLPRLRDDRLGFVYEWVLILFRSVWVWLPTMWYRWSLKATAIVYLPLVWVAWTGFRKPTSLRTEVKKLYEGEFASVVFYYSAFFIIAFAIKIFWMTAVGELGDWWNKNSLGRFLGIYVSPQNVPRWQIAAFVNSILAFGLYMFARRVLDSNLSGRFLLYILRVTQFVRCTLALYVIPCTIYLTFQALPEWELNLPELGTKWFPWQ